MHEKVQRNQSIYEYHLKHPQVSCAKIGRIFRHSIGGESKPLDASAVWRIIKRLESLRTLETKETMES